MIKTLQKKTWLSSQLKNIKQENRNIEVEIAIKHITRVYNDNVNLNFEEDNLPVMAKDLERLVLILIPPLGKIKHPVLIDHYWTT